MFNLNLRLSRARNSSSASRSRPSWSAPWSLHRCSATSRWRSRPGGRAALLQGGVAALIATSTVVEKEIRALPDFSNGLVVGLAVSAVLLIGLQKRTA